MGVKLGELAIREDIEFEKLKGKKIGIDFSNMAYQFLSSIRQRDGTLFTDSKGGVTSVYMGIINRVTNLMSKGLMPCFVFDGKKPLLKTKEIEGRIARKKQALEKFKEAKREKDIVLMSKYARMTSRLTFDILKDSKELLNALGLPVVQAPSEADAQLAFMNEKNDIWASASSDFDCLIHGSPRMLINLTLSSKRKLPSGAVVFIKPQVIELKKLLKNLKINQDQLIAMAILTGTDYNPGGVKGIGGKTALKLVKQYKTFDILFKEVKADFDWKKIYAVFKSMPIMKNYQLKWKNINLQKINNLLVKKHDFNEERLNSILSRLNKEEKKKEQIGLGRWI